MRARGDGCCGLTVLTRAGIKCSVWRAEHLIPFHVGRRDREKLSTRSPQGCKCATFIANVKFNGETDSQRLLNVTYLRLKYGDLFKSGLNLAPYLSVFQLL